MNEYSYEKNVNLDLDRITIGSNAKIWWKCTLGHEWQATVGNRSKGAGCPYCSNYKAWAGYNDLVTVNPKLASEWCYEKNGGLRPTSVKHNQDCHDRLIVLDYGFKTEQVFHCGASSKDAGKKLCAINAIADTSLIHPAIDKMLLGPDYTI